ncbi:MAG: toxin [Desulfobacterales bacterium]
MRYNWSDEKNEFLKKERHISFEDILDSVKNGGLIGIEPHYNKQAYGHQSVMFVNIRGYVYLVPFVWDEEKEEAFLKTIIPSRKHTKRLKEQL